ncbi:MAG: M56 family metallopeptidase [Planctomycetales bacterium]|nr:M56 family metallopeptidase [Planctomycetales bacterium]
MNELITKLNELSDVWFHAMRTATLQSIVVLVVAWSFATMVRRFGPRVVFWVWTAAAAKLLVLVVFPLSIAIPVTTRIETKPDVQISRPADLASFASEPLPAKEAPAASHAFRRHSTWKTHLCAAWCGLIAVQLTLIAKRKRKLMRLLDSCRPAKQSLQEMADRLTQKVGVTRNVRVLCGNVAVPFVTGIRRPVVVLPESFDALQRSELSLVLTHELAHVARNDLIWVWIPTFARMVFFFNPVMYVIQSEAILCRESACDQIVIKHGAVAGEYASVLLSMNANVKPSFA